MKELSLVSEDKDTIIFRSKNERFDILDFRIQIENGKNGWEWRFSAGVNYWNKVHIRNKKFILKNNIDNLSAAMVSQINKSFYEFFHELKSHPVYRLKLINMLNDDTREIWKSV